VKWGSGLLSESVRLVPGLVMTDAGDDTWVVLIDAVVSAADVPLGCSRVWEEDSLGAVGKRKYVHPELWSGLEEETSTVLMDDDIVVKADSALSSTKRALNDPLVVGLGDAILSVSVEMVEILIGS
jgi:hypothetical protein